MGFGGFRWRYAFSLGQSDLYGVRLNTPCSRGIARLRGNRESGAPERTISGAWPRHQQVSWHGTAGAASMTTVSRRAWIAFATCSVLWGIPYFLIKVAVKHDSPAFVAWARIAIGAVLLVPVAWRVGAFRGVLRRWRVVLAFAVVEVASRSR